MRREDKNITGLTGTDEVPCQGSIRLCGAVNPVSFRTGRGMCRGGCIITLLQEEAQGSRVRRTIDGSVSVASVYPDHDEKMEYRDVFAFDEDAPHS